MKIGIDARFYGPKQKGLGRYVKELVDNLEKIDSTNRYFIFLRQENWNEYRPQNPNFHKVLANYGWYGFKEQFFLPLKIKKLKPDLMFFPHFNVPVFYTGPYLVTIHDLILKKFPTRQASALGSFSYYFKNLIYHLVIDLAVKKARKVIAVSECTKKDILQYFKIGPKKIKVVYEGRPEVQITNYKLQITNSKLQTFGINKPYLLYVGNVYPHKNLERLIRAFDILIRKENVDLELVLVGKFDYFYRRLKNQVRGIKGIIFTDYVSDQDLAILYQNALLYIFPSLYEGFGLPPLEAMSYNLPVICSDASCLPEILGKAALYFNPKDINDMVKKIKQASVEDNLRKDLISSGQKQIKKYSWLKMAREILEIF